MTLWCYILTEELNIFVIKAINYNNFYLIHQE